MINHCRTLLLNRPGSTVILPNFIGEEFVPIDYVPARLSSQLQLVWDILFGTDPDRAMLNYRLRQYMSILHSTELEEFIYSFDERVTYWPIIDTQLYGGPSITPTAVQLNTPTKAFYLAGNIQSVQATSRLLTQWNVTVTDGSNVTINQLTTPLSTIVKPYTISNGLSNLIPLQNSYLQFMFQAGIGSTWSVQSVARPALGLSDIILSLENLEAINSQFVFGTTFEEPYKTFNEMWSTRSDIAYKLGGLLMALIFRMNALLL